MTTYLAQDRIFSLIPVKRRKTPPVHKLNTAGLIKVCVLVIYDHNRKCCKLLCLLCHKQTQ